MLKKSIVLRMCVHTLEMLLKSLTSPGHKNSYVDMNSYVRVGMTMYGHMNSYVDTNSYVKKKV